jgi:hypothetical protein
MTPRKADTEVHRKRRQVGREFGLSVDDWAVISLVSALVNYDTIQVRLAMREPVATDELAKAGALVVEARLAAQQQAKAKTEEPPPGLPFMLQIVSKKIHYVCERCGFIAPTSQDVPQPDHAEPKFKLPLLLPAPVDVDVEDDDDGD